MQKNNSLKLFLVIVLLLTLLLAGCNKTEQLNTFIREENPTEFNNFLDNVDKEKLSLILNTQDDSGNTPLIYAVKQNNTEMVKRLIELGADINIKNNKEDSALILSQGKEVTNLLLDGGADYNIADKIGWLVPMIAFYDKDYGKVEAFLEHELTPSAESMEVVLMSLSSANEFSENDFSMLLSTGVDINVQDDKGRTVLMKLIRKSDKSLISYLLEKGANPNLQDNDGETAIFYAGHTEGAIEKIRVLARNGAKINIQNNRGQTILMKFAEWAEYPQVEALIKMGANSLVRDKDGERASYYAIYKQRWGIAQYLWQKEIEQEFSYY